MDENILRIIAFQGQETYPPRASFNTIENSHTRWRTMISEAWSAMLTKVLFIWLSMALGDDSNTRESF